MLPEASHAAIHAEIRAALRKLEVQRGVRVLLAVESGSRAWGFASPDSDWDVRFVYAHPRDWYLSITEHRDVIEAMLPHDLDLAGWDLRKTLKLFAKCNLALNEWLDSPLSYGGDDSFAAELRALLPVFFRPTVGLFHYLKLGLGAYRHGCAEERVSLKKVFYVLRPLLACRWIEHTRSMPPTRFDQLKAADWVSPTERAWIGELEAAKARAGEAERSTLQPQLREWMLAEFTRVEASAASFAVKKTTDLGVLDQLLRKWVVAA